MAFKRNCRFEFFSEVGVFFSGDVMRGRVTLTLEEPKKCTGLELTITGGAKCQWVETYSTGKGTIVIVYTGREKYFEITNNLLTETQQSTIAQSKEYTVLPPGEHVYDFSAFIPAEALTSFEGVFGWVRYTAKLTLKRPGTLEFNQTQTASFTVLRQHNLNLLDFLKEPVEFKDEKTFHVFFSKAGTLTIKVNLIQTGYVPGQYIEFKCHLKNDSQVPIMEVKFYLTQVSVHKVTCPFKKKRAVNRSLSEYIYSGLEKGQEADVDGNLYVPAVPPTSDPNVPTILGIWYFFKIKARVTGMHKNFETKIPIEIGTIPLMALTDSNTASALEYLDYAPPTYEEAENTARMEEKKEKKKKGEEREEEYEEPIFTPRYPVFQSGLEKNGLS